MDLSIIIVNYNTAGLLSNAIDSIHKTTKGLRYEIIVSDNGSMDGSEEYIKNNYTDVIWISNNANLGFAKANNIGIKRAQGRHILLLNSDTVLMDNCLDSCVDYMDKHMDIGALGCKVILPDGSLDAACKRGLPTPSASLYKFLGLPKLFPKSRVFGQYNLTYLDEDEVNEVDSLVGAFMMVRREVIDEVGLLNENYFMFGEDIDWCYRIKEADWKIVYYPDAKIIHYKGGSGRNLKTDYEFHRAMYLFYNKHYRYKYPLVVGLLIYVGIFFRFTLSILINWIKRLFRGNKK